MKTQRLVLALTEMSCKIMVNPSTLPGEHDVFVSGNDRAAKAKVIEILKGWFGWKSVIDLGDITAARGTEQRLALWVRLMGTLGTANFNFKIIK